MNWFLYKSKSVLFLKYLPGNDQGEQHETVGLITPVFIQIEFYGL